jgi:hypothetical protein
MLVDDRVPNYTKGTILFLSSPVGKKRSAAAPSSRTSDSFSQLALQNENRTTLRIFEASLERVCRGMLALDPSHRMELSK